MSLRRGRACQAAALFAALLSGGLVTGCQGAPVDVGEPEVEPAPPPPAPPAELPAGAVIELGTDAAGRGLEGFSLPERVGSRLASWSEGELSTITFELRGGAKNYLVAFLAEPYHMLGDVPLGLSLNQSHLADTTLARGWRGYRFVVPGDRIRAGRNELSFHYTKTGRPSDFDSTSSDVRSLSARFDQVQVQPIGERVELAFGSKNALGLAALGDGWARDPNDRGTGTWTVGARSLITFAIAKGGADAPGSMYTLALTARSPRGVAARRVDLTLNGAPIGTLAFSEQKTTAELELSAEHVKPENEIALEFSKLESPAELDASSKDKRLLGLRVFELELSLRQGGARPASAPSPGAERPAHGPSAHEPSAREANNLK